MKLYEGAVLLFIGAVVIGPMEPEIPEGSTTDLCEIALREFGASRAGEIDNGTIPESHRGLQWQHFDNPGVKYSTGTWMVRGHSISCVPIPKNLAGHVKE